MAPISNDSTKNTGTLRADEGFRNEPDRLAANGIMRLEAIP